MWRHDCSRKWPVDCGHESFCSGPHVERTKEQGHSDSHLLAWQPRIESLLPAVCWRRKSLWCGTSTITPRFLSAQRSAPASPGSLHFEHTQWPPSGAVLGSSQDCPPSRMEAASRPTDARSWNDLHLQFLHQQQLTAAFAAAFLPCKQPYKWLHFGFCSFSIGANISKLLYHL